MHLSKLRYSVFSSIYGNLELTTISYNNQTKQATPFISHFNSQNKLTGPLALLSPPSCQRIRSLFYISTNHVRGYMVAHNMAVDKRYALVAYLRSVYGLPENGSGLCFQGNSLPLISCMGSSVALVQSLSCLYLIIGSAAVQLLRPVAMTLASESNKLDAVTLKSQKITVNCITCGAFDGPVIHSSGAGLERHLKITKLACSMKQLINN